MNLIIAQAMNQTVITQITNQLSGNATETEENLTENEITGENLIIDENTDKNHIHEHSLMCSCTSKNNELSPNNKETNNKILLDVI